MELAIVRGDGRAELWELAIVHGSGRAALPIHQAAAAAAVGHFADRHAACWPKTTPATVRQQNASASAFCVR